MRNDLIAAATDARLHAIAPFSGFKVGAAIETAAGRVFTGCNVENASLGLTVCAERVALLKALSEGERTFTTIAVVTNADEPATPCGACRQLLWEYCGNISVQMQSLNGSALTIRLEELFPRPFGSGYLSTGKSD
jgi:cytidine deaminase